MAQVLEGFSKNVNERALGLAPRRSLRHGQLGESSVCVTAMKTSRLARRGLSIQMT